MRVVLVARDVEALHDALEVVLVRVLDAVHDGVLREGGLRAGCAS